MHRQWVIKLRFTDDEQLSLLTSEVLEVLEQLPGKYWKIGTDAVIMYSIGESSCSAYIPKAKCT